MNPFLELEYAVNIPSSLRLVHGWCNYYYASETSNDIVGEELFSYLSNPVPAPTHIQFFIMAQKVLKKGTPWLRDYAVRWLRGNGQAIEEVLAELATVDTSDFEKEYRKFNHSVSDVPDFLKNKVAEEHIKDF